MGTTAAVLSLPPPPRPGLPRLFLTVGFLFACFLIEKSQAECTGFVTD